MKDPREKELCQYHKFKNFDSFWLKRERDLQCILESGFLLCLNVTSYAIIVWC